MKNRSDSMPPLRCLWCHRSISKVLNPGLAFLFLCVLLWASGCQAPLELPTTPAPTAPLRDPQLRGFVPEDGRIADYVLDVRLDAVTHSVSGTAQVHWRNTTEYPTEILPFHLYMNGFRAEDTAWMRSSQGRHRRNEQQRDGPWGFIDIHSVRLRTPATETAGAATPPKLLSTPLDWSEDADPSTMTVRLPRAVEPGESIQVELSFTTQLPRVLARTGYHDDFYAVGQWYPKIGVLEPDGRWEVHTFTVHDEFFADFGTYTVHLDVPENMVVGATGVRTGQSIADGRQQLTYEAEMVHDFAWMADTDFVEHSVEHRGIFIRQLIQPDQVQDATAHMAVQIDAIDSYEKRCGPYPWSTLTLVHPPEGAEGAGGMEYPTLFTSSDRASLPQWIRDHVFDERVSGLNTTVHEFGHQYFQGLLASREHLEPWLDEGVNAFSNYLAAADRYGEENWMVNILGNKIAFDEALSLMTGRVGDLDPVDQPASAFQTVVGSYRAVYVKVSTLLITLRNLVGHAAFDRAFRAYCEHGRFRQPTGEDFAAVLKSELGEQVPLAVPDETPVYLSLDRYLQQALRTTREVDFAIKEITNIRRVGQAGWHRDAAGDLIGGAPPEKLGQPLDALGEDELTGVLAVHRAGSFVVPVEILVEFMDGGSQYLLWDAEKTTKVFRWPGRPVRRASLDPDGKLVLEWRRLNNSAWAGGEKPPAQDLSRSVGGLFEALSLAILGGFAP